MENQFFNVMQDISNKTKTTNNATTNISSLDFFLDVFYYAGSIRTETEVNNKVLKYYDHLTDDMDRFIRLLLWSRDIKKGAGVRAVLYYTLASKPEILVKYNEGLIKKIIELGSYRDLIKIYELSLLNKNKSNFDIIFNFLIKEYKRILSDDLFNGHQILCKWTPRNGYLFNQLSKHLKIKKKDLRKLIVKHSNTVEQKITLKQFRKIDYSAVPSKAFKKHAITFKKFDKDRFERFIEKVNNKKAKINASTIYPYEILFSKNDTKVIDAMWKNLPKLDNNTRFMPMVDVSGSMETYLPKSNISLLQIAVSLGIYFSENNKSEFKDTVLTFSQIPQFVFLSDCKNVVEKRDKVIAANWSANTDLFNALDLILKRAVQYNVKQEDMPNYLIILSDMQFDQAVDDDSITDPIGIAKKRYNMYRYEAPKVIFWNLSTDKGIPAIKTEKDVCLISGFSPYILDILTKNPDDMTPYSIMLSVLNQDRYKID